MKSATLPTTPKPSARVRFKNVLFATDLGAASAQAQAYAVLVARTLGSHLYVLHAESGPGLSPRYEGTTPMVGDAAEKPGMREIKELEMLLRVSGIPYTLLVVQGEVHDALNRVMQEHPIDLIVLGSHGRKGISHLLMGSISEGVTRSAKCPVITVGPQAFSGFENPLRTIVFATDFSEESKLALPYAISLAQEFRARLSMLHVAPQYESIVRDHDRVRGYLLDQLKNLAPQARFPWCSVAHIVTFGDTPREILKVAKVESADLIVLGLHSAVHFTSHLPERLSYKILCEAPCPVMSVLPGMREMKLSRIPKEFLSGTPDMN